MVGITLCVCVSAAIVSAAKVMRCILCSLVLIDLFFAIQLKFEIFVIHITTVFSKWCHVIIFRYKNLDYLFLENTVSHPN